MELDRSKSATLSQSNAGVFKKRARSGASKTRKRTRPVDDVETDSRVKLPQQKTKVPKKKKSSWQRELFSTGAERAPSFNATAERGDVGGDDAPPKTKKKAFGPMRAPAHLRTSVRVDYQPDVCKDYKETGYCGFGDSCKFLHDRSDYKAGWQLERDWAEKEKRKRDALLRGENPNCEEANENTQGYDEDGLPFACFLCREEFKSPVKTLCDHYFCEKCALVRMEKDSTCPICKKQLRDTLNPAPKLIAKLQLKHGL